MKTNVAETSMRAYRGLQYEGLQVREREVMALFTNQDVVLSRKQIWKQLCVQLGDHAPGEGGTCGRVNKLINDRKLLVSRGERYDSKTHKHQEVVGLPVDAPETIFS
jgi:hypothetical protein